MLLFGKPFPFSIVWENVQYAAVEMYNNNSRVLFHSDPVLFSKWHPDSNTTHPVTLFITAKLAASEILTWA